MLTKVRGRFVDVAGSITVADDPADSHVEVTIAMASVNSGDQSRDDHLRSEDFFDVDRWPEARFVSTSVVWAGTSGEVTGNLTIKEVTRPVVLAVEYLGHVVDPWDNHRAVFTATSTIDREDWDLTWNLPLANGGLVVSKGIDLELQVETILQP